jgi:hypothetical protein
VGICSSLDELLQRQGCSSLWWHALRLQRGAQLLALLCVWGPGIDRAWHQVAVVIEHGACGSSCRRGRALCRIRRRQPVIDQAPDEGLRKRMVRIVRIAQRHDGAGDDAQG